MLEPEAARQLDTFVRAGFLPRSQIVEILTEELYAPGELDPIEVEAALDDAINRLEAEKQGWPEQTDFDRLMQAFEVLNSEGVVSIHNAGFTQSDGYESVRDALHSHANRDEAIGYCFYHSQDVESAIAGRGLFLAFGPIDSSAEEEAGPKIGALIRNEMHRVDLAVDWDGTFKTRLKLSDFQWRRR